MSVGLSALDRCFCLIESKNSCQVIGDLWVFAEMPQVDLLKVRISKVFKEVYSLSDKQRVGNFEPKSDDFLKIFDLPETSVSQSFDLTLGQLFTEPMPLGSPLIHATLIRRKTNPALLMRMHHSFADGLSMIEISKLLFDKSAELDEDSFNLRVKNFFEAQAFFPSPPKSLGLSEDLKFIPKLIGKTFASTHKGIIRGPSSQQRKVETFSLPLKNLGRLKHIYNVSLNDLVLCVITGALRGFYLGQGHSIDSSPVVLVPTNLRSKRERRRFGNFISYLSFKLPIRAVNTIERLNLVSKLTSEIKVDGSSECFSIASRLFSVLPKFLSRPMVRFVVKKNNFIATNVPFTRQVRYLVGAKLVERFGIPALLPENGLGFSVVLYEDRIGCSIISDPGIVSSVDSLRESFFEAYSELVQLQGLGEESEVANL